MTTASYESLTITDQTVSITNISLSAGTRPLLRNANLTIVPGHRYGIIAKNGLGKSTLLATLAEWLSPHPLSTLFLDQYMDPEKWSTIASDTITNVVLRANTERFALIERANALEELDTTETALEYAAIQEQLTAIGADKDVSEVKRILRGLGFATMDLERPFSEFSGGWKRRVLMAKAFYMRPKILFADEITNDLDLNAVAWLSDYLVEWPGSLVLISHNLAFLNSICTDILTFERARPPLEKFESLTDFHGTTATWGCTIQQYRGNYNRYKKMATDSAKIATRAWELFEKQYAELRKANKKTEAAQLLKKRGQEGCFRPEQVKRVSVQFPSMRQLSSPIIELEDVDYAYGTTTVLADINLRIAANARLTIVGANGSGKTTLLGLLTGKLTPTIGEYKQHGALVTHYYNQQTVELLPVDMTPIEYLVSATGQKELDVRGALGRMGLEGTTHTIKIGSLSGGQRVRVAIAEFQLRPSHILILDEITNHLDIEAIEAMIEGIRVYEGAVVVVSHDADFITEIGCDLLYCHDGYVEEYKGTIEDYLEETIASEE